MLTYKGNEPAGVSVYSQSYSQEKQLLTFSAVECRPPQSAGLQWFRDFEKEPKKPYAREASDGKQTHTWWPKSVESNLRISYIWVKFIHHLSVQCVTQHHPAWPLSSEKKTSGQDQGLTLTCPATKKQTKRRPLAYGRIRAVINWHNSTSQAEFHASQETTSENSPGAVFTTLTDTWLTIINTTTFYRVPSWDQKGGNNPRTE
jgi:hypothetical protein